MRFVWMAAALLGACATAPEGPAPLSHDALMAHVTVLSSDEFEGRSPGTRGEQLTVDYISRAFADAGLQPGAEGGWVQEVPLATAEVSNTPTLRIGDSSYAYGTDFVAWTKRQHEPAISLEHAELVFVGYGVTAPENQ